jgi:hypothetical protein
MIYECKYPWEQRMQVSMTLLIMKLGSLYDMELHKSKQLIEVEK